jgi:hypothetical protein
LRQYWIFSTASPVDGAAPRWSGEQGPNHDEHGHNGVRQHAQVTVEADDHNPQQE